MSLIKYQDLTDFQKWLFFYLAIYDTVPKNMKGVIPKMCSGLKMKINLDDFENQEQLYQKEAIVLFENGLLHNTSSSARSPNDRYGLSAKGEIYILQKIIGPIIIAKDKDKIKEILDYFITKDEPLTAQISAMLLGIKKEDFRESFKTIATKAMQDFTPFITALDKLHDMAKDFGIDPAIGGG